MSKYWGLLYGFDLASKVQFIYKEECEYVKKKRVKYVVLELKRLILALIYTFL